MWRSKIRRSRRVVFAKHRHASDEDEIKPALRVDHDEPAVECEVEIAILLVAGGAQLAEAARRNAIDAELGDERSALRLAEEDRTAVEDERSQPANHQAIEGDERGCAARQGEAAETRSARHEELDATTALRCVGDDEAAVGVRRQMRTAGECAQAPRRS